MNHLVLCNLQPAMNSYSFLFLLFSCLSLTAQPYPPAAGQPGSTALHKDSVIFVNWATTCTVQRGYQNIANPSLGLASAGDSSAVPGKAGLNGVLSLGDGGSAICTFPLPIQNGSGFDFAVFENAFDNSFLELAFVEVSSDGLNYFRFPSHSLTDTLTQVGAFDPLDATKLNNLAGKYREGYGTPFDLQELAGQAGLDLNNIRFVKIIDVRGSVLPAFCSRDAFGNKVNDPWPTPFPSSGFDLDAVGVIHQNLSATLPEKTEEEIHYTIFPNPASSGGWISLQGEPNIRQVQLSTLDATVIIKLEAENRLLLPSLKPGLYLISIYTELGRQSKKLIIY